MTVPRHAARCVGLAFGTAALVQYYFRVDNNSKRSTFVAHRFPLHLHPSKFRFALAKAQDGPEQLSDAERRQAYFDAAAPSFDSKVAQEELIMGIKRQRKRLMKKAKGDVLDVAAGTGRNLVHYAKARAATHEQQDSTGGKFHCAVKRVVLLDSSEPMLRVARETAQRLQLPFGVSFVVSRAEDLSSETLGEFDTVVDTFGLCSYADPVAALRGMARVLRKPSNDSPDGGHILLLEHGKSRTWGMIGRFLNDKLDSDADHHAKNAGCWWNRDIEEIVRQSGLEVVEHKTKNFGTTHIFVCRLPVDAQSPQLI